MNFKNITSLDYKLLTEKYKGSKLASIIKKIEEEDYPVQYAIGNVQFYYNFIHVDERVLIPRFETELLVDKLLKYIKIRKLENSNIVDICTGSGCIAISLKKNLENSKVEAIDISNDALKVARLNAKLNKVDITFMEKDILKENIKDAKYSVIVSNPPYVKSGEIVSNNTKYEPKIALYPGEDDIIFYKRILDLSKNMLNSRGIIAFEIGATQGESIIKYTRKIYPQAKIDLEKDYNNLERYIFINV